MLPYSPFNPLGGFPLATVIPEDNHVSDVEVVSIESSQDSDVMVTGVTVVPIEIFDSSQEDADVEGIAERLSQVNGSQD